MFGLQKEKCDSCEKKINIGQCITECSKCLNIIHSRCYSKSNFKKLNQKFYCKICQPSIMIRYNPFKKQIDELDNDSEHFFDQDANVVLGNLQEASQVLENCENLLSKDVTQLINEKHNSFNTYFYNIDGN